MRFYNRVIDVSSDFNFTFHDNFDCHKKLFDSFIYLFIVFILTSDRTQMKLQ